jgi:hypothetical protein
MRLRDLGRHRDPFGAGFTRLRKPLLFPGVQTGPPAAAATAGPITPETIRAAVTERFRRWAAAGAAATAAPGGLSAAAAQTAPDAASAASDVAVLEGAALLALASSFGFPSRRDPGFLVLCYAVMRHADTAAPWTRTGPGSSERWASGGSNGNIPRSVAFFDAACADPGAAGAGASNRGAPPVGLGIRLPLDAWVAAHINLSAMDERALVVAEWARLQADLRASCGHFVPATSPPPMSLIAVCRNGLARANANGAAATGLVAQSALLPTSDAAASRSGVAAATSSNGAAAAARGAVGFWSTAAATGPASAMAGAGATRHGESYSAFHRFLFFSQLSHYNMGWLTVRRHYEMKVAAITVDGNDDAAAGTAGADAAPRHGAGDGGPAAAGVHAALGVLGERFRGAAARASSGSEVKLTRNQTVSLLHLFFARVSLHLMWPGVAPAALRRQTALDWEETLLRDLCGFDPTSCIFGIPRVGGGLAAGAAAAAGGGDSSVVGAAPRAAGGSGTVNGDGGSGAGLAGLAGRLTAEQLRSLPMLLPTVTTLTSLWVRTVLLMTLGQVFPFLTMQFVHFLDQGGGNASTCDVDTAAAAFSMHMNAATGAALNGRAPWATPPPMSFDQWQSLLRAFTEAERLVLTADRRAGRDVGGTGGGGSYATFVAAMTAQQACVGEDVAVSGPAADAESAPHHNSPCPDRAAAAFGDGADKSRAAFWSAGERRRAMAFVQVVVPQLVSSTGAPSPSGRAYNGTASFTCAAGYAYGALEDTSYWPLLLDRFAAWLMEAMTPADAAISG